MKRTIFTGVRSVHGVLSDLRMFDKPDEILEAEFLVEYVPELHFGDSEARGDDVRFGLHVVYQDGTDQTHWFDHMSVLDHGRYHASAACSKDGENVTRISQSDPPSEKQMKYAEQIAKRLGIPMPSYCSKKSLWKFISENADDYKEACYCDRDAAETWDEDNGPEPDF